MADYWKSQPRKFCQYCKCWIADNKPSVEFHERGKNHKENVSLKIAEIKKKSQDKAKQDEKMSKEFATMEEAAMKAYKEDLKRMQLEAGEPVTEDEPEVPPQPSPPPPTQEKPPKQEKPHRKASKGKAGKPEKAGKVPKPNLWLEGKSDDGHVYYYHSKTGESSWEKPEGFQERQESHLGQKEGSSVGAWMEAVSPEGYTYYFNSETGESSWERPAHLPPPDEPTAPGTEPTPEREGPPGDPGAPPDAADAAAVAAPTGAPDEADPPPAAAEDPRVSVEASHKRKAEPLRNEGEGERGEEEEEKKEVQQEEEAALPPKETQEAKEEREAKEEQERRRAKRPKKTTPYGTWEQIQPEEDPYAKVDLQLPQVEEVDEGPEELSLPPEAKPKFRERTITSLGADMGGGGPTSFRKSKTHNGKARSLRQRGEDD